MAHTTQKRVLAVQNESSPRRSTSRFFAWLACAGLLCGAPPSVCQAQSSSFNVKASDNSLELAPGEQRVLPAQGVKSYSEGVKGVVDVRLTGDASRFVVVGIAPGLTTLLMLMVDGTERLYTIAVRDPNAAAPGAPSSAISVVAQASIRLDLYFVQVDRKRSLDLGVSMPSNLGQAALTYATGVPASALTTGNSAIISTAFVPKLNAAQSRGYAKVSRHVAVITTNGTQANFESGGEFNALSTQSLGTSVVSIKYGSKLSVQPRYDAESGRIELSVSADVSDLSATGAAVPGRTTSTVTSISNLALGESLAIAGLVSTTAERSRAGLPWLSQIPIIGLLFGQQSTKFQETENLVFISPSVVEPLKPARAREFLANAVRQFEDFNGNDDTGVVFPGSPWALPSSQPRVAPADR
jgi:pilus assembly protein CpaC